MCYYELRANVAGVSLFFVHGDQAVVYYCAFGRIPQSLEQLIAFSFVAVVRCVAFVVDLRNYRDDRATMEEDSLENSLTEMDWLLQLNGFTSGEADDRRNPDLENGAVDFSVVRTSERSCSPVLNYKSKPPFSYTHLISEAISSTERKRMSLSEIYQWIRENYPYYRSAAPGWKVRSDL